MSKLDESPALKFKRGFDINVVVPTTRLENFVRINNRDQKIVIESEVEDGALHGTVEGWLQLKAGYDQDCERLELEIKTTSRRSAKFFAVARSSPTGASFRVLF